MESESARVRRIYDREAPVYDRGIAFCERVLFPGARTWVADQVRGRTLEIGIGTGRNLEHYSEALALVGLDLSRPMLALARERAARWERPPLLLQADAERLPFPDQSFDCVVSTLSLCTIADERRALEEAKRVLRSGGRLVLVEHVGSPRPGIRAVQRLLEPLSARFLADHLVRQPRRHLEELGFEIATLESRRLGVVEQIVAFKR
jgi:ubiquinone/menaquinone biosynthesis C-methylase UbiE